MLYEALQPWQTRLIKLHPGLPDDDLECSLFIADIVAFDGLGVGAESTIQSYDALSYSWGRAELQALIKCNGAKVWTPPSMAEALAYLRYIDRPRWLWCDALCINQNDNREKSMQVRNMLRIFRKAKRVVVWLGIEDSNTALAFEVINDRYRRTQYEQETQHESRSGSNAGMLSQRADVQEYTTISRTFSPHPASKASTETLPSASLEASIRLNHKQSHRILKRRATRERLREQLQRASRGRDLTRQEICPKHGTRRSRCCSPVNQTMSHHVVPAMQKLMSRPWFSRTWVRQECYAAEQIILHCGSHTALFNDLFDFVRRHDLISGTLHSLYSYARSTEEDRKREDQELLDGQAASRWRPLIPPMSTFLHVLRTGRYFNATDDKDRVYALAGMVADVDSRRNPRQAAAARCSPEFPIDYTKSCNEVYQDLIKYMINKDKNLDCLNYFGLRQPAEALPSWVMDWRYPDSCSEPFIHTNEDRIQRLQRPENDEPELLAPPAQDLSKLGELNLTGSILGELDTPDGKIKLDRYIALGRDLKPWQSLARDPYMALRYKVHSRLLYRKHDDDDDIDTPSLPAHLRLAELWERGDYIVCPLRTHSGKTFRNHSLTLLHVRDFIVPKTARAGDVVALMTGTAVPYVLRPVHNDREKYRLIGICWYREGGRYDEQEVENHFVADSVLSMEDGPFQNFVLV